jgi:hypothetical protein
MKLRYFIDEKEIKLYSKRKKSKNSEKQKRKFKFIKTKNFFPISPHTNFFIQYFLQPQFHKFHHNGFNFYLSLAIF